MGVTISAQEQKQRVGYIDTAKAIGMLLVIAGHIVSSQTPIKQVLYAFHMPLFFLLSGMTIHYRETYSFSTWRSLIVRRAKGILLPYLIWALIYAQFTLRNLAYILYGSREMLIRADTSTPLWFFPVLFLSSLLAEAVMQITKGIRRYRGLAVLAFAVLLAAVGYVFPHLSNYGDPWGIDIAFMAASFIVIGFLFKKLIKRFDGTPLKLAAMASCLLVFALLVGRCSSSVGYVLMANADYGNAVSFYLTALSGSAFVVLGCNLLTSLTGKTRILQWIGQRTLGLLVTHKLVVNFGRKVATKIGLSFDHILVLAVLTVITLIVCMVWVFFIERILPELIGLKKKGGLNEQNISA